MNKEIKTLPVTDVTEEITDLTQILYLVLVRWPGSNWGLFNGYPTKEKALLAIETYCTAPQESRVYKIEIPIVSDE